MSALDDILKGHELEEAAKAAEAEAATAGASTAERRAFIRRAFFVFLEKGFEIDVAWTLAYGAWQRKPEDC